MDRMSAMELFVRVVETKSFSAVAKERGIGQPTVSKQISAMEAELGTELLHRNTRSMTLTEAGSDFYHAAQRILEDFENATSRIGRGQIAPKGVVRVAVPPSFARLHMVSKLAAFFERYPDIAVEFGTSESPASLIEDGFDLAIHSGDLPDSSLVARRFAQTLTILVATPQFVTRHRLPQLIDELRALPAIPFVQNGTVQPWEFSSAQRITPSGVFRTGDLEQLRVGVLEHLGIRPGSSVAVRRGAARGDSAPAFDLARADGSDLHSATGEPACFGSRSGADGTSRSKLRGLYTVQPPACDWYG